MSLDRESLNKLYTLSLTLRPDFLYERLVNLTALRVDLNLKLRVLRYQHLKVAVSLAQLLVKVLHVEVSLSGEDPPGQSVVSHDRLLQRPDPAFSLLRILGLKVECLVVHSDGESRVVLIVYTNKSPPEPDTPRQSVQFDGCEVVLSTHPLLTPRLIFSLLV